MNLWLFLAFYTICSTSGLLLIKSGFNIHKLDGDTIHQMKNLPYILTDGRFLLGFLLYVTGFIIWLYILSKHDLSVTFPVASGVLYIGLLIGSILWLHEGVGVVRIVGVLLILTGIIIVSRS